MAKVRSNQPPVVEVIETSDPCGNSGVLLAVRDGEGEVNKVARAVTNARILTVVEAKPRSGAVLVKSSDDYADSRKIVTRPFDTGESQDQANALALHHLKEAEALRAAGEDDLAWDYVRFAREALEAAGPRSEPSAQRRVS